MVPTALLLQAPSSIVPPLSSSSASNHNGNKVVLSSASSSFTSASSPAVVSCPCSSPSTSLAVSSLILTNCICATPGFLSQQGAIRRQSTWLKQLGMRGRSCRGAQPCRSPLRTWAFFDLNGNQGEEGRPNCITKVLHKFAILLTATAAAVSLYPAALPADAFARGPIFSDLAVLISGPPIKDPNALLRYALPINNKPIKEVQKSLEDISENLRVPGSKALDPVERNIRQAARILNQNKPAILASIADSKKEYGDELLDKLNLGLQEFQRIVEEKNREAVAPKQKELLIIVGNVEEAMVDKFPFEVPEEYASKPLLKGRATVEMKVKVKDNPNLKDVVFQMVLDGYSAPVTAGNFVDLVERHFYDGMEIQRADGFVVQTGDPDGPAEGFVDPSTEKIRTIPLEIMVDGDNAPIYGATLEDLGRYKARTKLPFNAFGTLAMARDEFENDSASSQIFWLLKESELTPSNANILDGRYTVFGYVTDNQDYLADLKVGDVIESMKIVSGLDNLVNPSYKIVG